MMEDGEDKRGRTKSMRKVMGEPYFEASVRRLTTLLTIGLMVRKWWDPVGK